MKKNYEEVVDFIMLNEVCKDDTELKAEILNLDRTDKRLAILDIMANDKNEIELFKKIAEVIKADKVSKAQHIKLIVKELRKYVGVSECAIKQHGEVMTPIELVEEMLDTLPKDVWTNPNLKWLDPANGVGIFPCIVVERLMEGLVEFEPDEDLRYKHIMENMIYVCELQTKNMFIFQCGFDPYDEVELNIHNGSFLEDGFNFMMKEWGVDKFDIIIGNPPYQEQKIENVKSKPLWQLFVNISLNVLIENGYLVMVHPSGWRNIDGVFKETQLRLLSKTLLKLSLNDFNAGKLMFNASTNYDFYCLKNCKNSNKIKTEINNADNVIEYYYINNCEFIPNGYINEIFSLMAIENQEKIKVLYSRSCYGTDKKNMNIEKTDEFKYPCMYTITKKDGIKCYYSNIIKNEHFNIPKVIWSNGLGTYPILDINGEYGLTQFSYAIEDTKENLVKIKFALEHPRFLKLCKYIKFTNNIYDYKIISSFRKDFWKEFIN